MKKIVGLVAFAFLLSVGGTQEVSAGVVNKAKGYANKAKGYYDQAGKYKKTKKYNDISNKKARTAIKLLCQKGCNRFTCGNSGEKKLIGVACKQMCPRKDVRKCVGKL